MCIMLHALFIYIKIHIIVSVSYHIVSHIVIYLFSSYIARSTWSFWFHITVLKDSLCERVYSTIEWKDEKKSRFPPKILPFFQMKIFSSIFYILSECHLQMLNSKKKYFIYKIDSCTYKVYWMWVRACVCLCCTKCARWSI